MSRQFAKTVASLSIFSVGLFCGCQRPMGGTASGPFAPAGTLAPATSQPLIPFGPLNGATRVPPPPTGSTQASNGYVGPSAMTTAMSAGNANAYDSFTNSANPSAGAPAQSPQLSANSRSNLGGMPVIDLTAGMNSGQNMPVAYGNQVVGSGIAGSTASQGNGWQTGFAQTSATMPEPSISVPPGDLASRLRPLDSSVAAGAIPLPGQPGISQPGFGPATTSPVALTPYPNQVNVPSPAWQAVQPTSASAISTNPSYVSQLPTGPSTDPVLPPTSTGSQTQTQNNSLLWRNPSVVR